MRIIRLKGIEVTLGELVRSHFPDLSPGEHVLDRYRTVLAAGREFLEPAAVLEAVDELAMEGIFARIEVTLPATFARLLRFRQSCIGAYLVFCTVGPRLEQEVRRYCQNSEVANGFILDALGSLWVAKYSREVQMLLAREAAGRGLKIGVPVMPGSRGIDLDLHRLLFDLVHPEVIGMRLTEHSLMIPSKSLSMILGVGHNPDAGAVGHDCLSCEKEAHCFLKELWTSTSASTLAPGPDPQFQDTGS